MRLRSCLRRLCHVPHNDARTIVQEAQRRAESKSQRYEGLLQVFDARARSPTSAGRSMRLGSHGRSKAVLRFLAPPGGQRRRAADCESSRSRLRPVDVDAGARSASVASRCRIARRDSSAPTSASRISRSATSISTTTRCSATRPSTARRAGGSSRRRRRRRSSQYTRSVVWIRKTTTRLPRSRSYIKARRGSAAEVQRFRATSRASGRRAGWRWPTFGAGSRTVLTLEKLEYNVPLKDEDFTLQALRNPS